MERVATLQTRQIEIDTILSNFGLSETMDPIPGKSKIDGKSMIPFSSGINSGQVQTSKNVTAFWILIRFGRLNNHFFYWWACFGQSRDGLAHGFGRMDYDMEISTLVNGTQTIVMVQGGLLQGSIIPAVLFIMESGRMALLKKLGWWRRASQSTQAAFILF
jgi:hypothetical protein